MELQIYFAFIVATAVMVALPGPSVLLTVAHSISFGWKDALATVTGETMGVAVQLIIAAAGLVSLLHSVAELFDWIRWGGAAYLVYIGIKQWFSAGQVLQLETAAVSRTSLFVQGLVVTILNPKSLIFIAAFLPQFIDPDRPLGLQFIIIVPTFLVITFTVASLWALAAGKASTCLQKPGAARILFRIAGGLMVVAGIGLALAMNRTV